MKSEENVKKREKKLRQELRKNLSPHKANLDQKTFSSKLLDFCLNYEFFNLSFQRKNSF